MDGNIVDDDFSIDWELIHQVNKEQTQQTSLDNQSQDNTILNNFDFFVGDLDEDTVGENTNFILSEEEKFEIFVDALAEEKGSDDEWSDSEISDIKNVAFFDDIESGAQGNDSDNTEDEFQQPAAEINTQRRSERLCSLKRARQSKKSLNKKRTPPSKRVSKKKRPWKAPWKRTDGLRPEVAEIIHGGGKKKTKSLYKRHFMRYFNYCKSEKQDLLKESTACNYFHDMIQTKKIGVGSLWTVYAAVNSGMKQFYGVKMNKWEELKKLLLSLMKTYILKKSGILTREQLHKVLTECFDASIGVDLLCLIIISLMIAGLLRQTEVFMIEVDEVKLCENTRRVFFEFAHATKTRARGFGFMLPTGTYQWFRSYIRTLAPKKGFTTPLAKTQFLKNHNVKTGKRYLNTGRDRISYILRRIEVFLGLPKGTLTSHCFRRTGATLLANSDISLIGLKRAGRWKGFKSAEEYLEYSVPAQEYMMDRLLGRTLPMTQETRDTAVLALTQVRTATKNNISDI